jgi:hypothetical protein
VTEVSDAAIDASFTEACARPARSRATYEVGGGPAMVFPRSWRVGVPVGKLPRRTGFPRARLLPGPLPGLSTMRDSDFVLPLDG